MIKNKKVIALAILLLLIGSGAYFLKPYKQVYSCTARGDLLRYQDGVKTEEKTREDGAILFELVNYSYSNKIQLVDFKNFPEHQNEKIVFDKARSNDVETYFTYDETDSATKFRTVTSLFFNQVNGDVRLFHHRWIPPNEWKNSDLYSYSGFCLPKK